MARKYFGNIVVQSKDDLEDFRSFAHVQDEDGNWWELRGYGRTAGEAAQNAWNRYQEPTEEWEFFGYTTDPPT